MKNKISIGLGLLLALFFSTVWSADNKQPLNKPKTPVNQESLGKAKEEAPSPLADQVPWSSVNGGGALNMSSTNYKVHGTEGQSGIGYGTSTNYQAGLGFWYGACTNRAGDANGSGGNPTLPDIIYLVNYIFKGGPAPTPICAGDANGSGGAPGLPDIIYLVNYVFKGGPAPVKSGVCCL